MSSIVKKFVVTDAELVGHPNGNQTVLEILQRKGAPVKGLFLLGIEPGWGWTCIPGQFKTTYIFHKEEKVGEAKRKAEMAVENAVTAAQVGRAIGNWFIILTVWLWGGFLILGAYLYQFFDGEYSRQKAIDTMTGRKRFLE